MSAIVVFIVVRDTSECAAAGIRGKHACRSKEISTERVAFDAEDGASQRCVAESARALAEGRADARIARVQIHIDDPDRLGTNHVIVE